MLHVSYQLYSSRHWPLPETLAMLAETGFTAVEGYGALLAEPEPLFEALEANGLRMTTAHVALPDIEANPDALVRIADWFGIEAVFVPVIPPEERPADPSGWEVLARRVMAAGAPIREAGLRFGWHNHDFELADLGEGDRPLDHIASAGLDLEIDIGWVVRSGAVPEAIVERYGNRIVAAHVKDVAPAGENIEEDGWSDVGDGVVDWPAVHAALQAAGVARYVVEHDNPSDHRRFASRSLAAVRRL